MGNLGGHGGGQAAADPRFAAMHSDPRFQRFPKHKNKVVVDKRFSAMFEDPEFQSRSSVDKRGRKVEARGRNEDLRRYYRLRDEDEWREDGGDGKDAELQAGLPLDRQPAVAQKQRKQGKGKAVGGNQSKKLKQQVRQAMAQTTMLQDQGKAGKDKDAKAVAGDAAVGRARLREAKRQRAGAVASGVAARGTAVRQSDAVAADGRESEEDMKELEEIKENEEVEEEEEEEEGDASDDATEGEEEEGGEEAKARERWARARGMLGSESSDESDEDGEGYDSADEALTDEEYESDEHLDPEEWGAGANALNPEEPIPPQEETRRLALVDLDWDHVRAVDVLAVLRSFLPRGGLLERVTVYPSDYGLQRMAEEEAAGPKLILKPTQRAGRGSTEAAAASVKETEDGGKENGKKRRGKAGDEEVDDGVEVDKKRLAAYEKSRLRYYYCIIECDCIATALHLYNECDGMEFERSACKFDIRFVPDDQSFEGRQIRDTATEVPPGYEPPAHFNISLQHTDPKLSWDAEDPERKRKLQGRRLKTDQELLEADFAAYLGSEEDDDEEEEKDALLLDQQQGQDATATTGAGEKQEGANGGRRSGKEDAEALRRRYRALLLGEAAANASKTKGRVGGKSWLGGEDGEEGTDDEKQAEEEEDRQVRARGRQGAGEPSTSGRDGGGGKGDVDMVVTFHSGLEGLGERLKKKKEEERARAGETVWEAYLRKKREKRALRRAQGRLRNLSDSEDSEDYISDGEGDAGGSGKIKGKAKETEKKGKNKKDRTDKCNDGGDDDDMYGDVVPDDLFFQGDNKDPFADPFFNQDGGGVDAEAASASDDSDGGEWRRANERKEKSKKGGKAGDKAATDGERADLELLLMDDSALRDAARGVRSRVLPAGHDDAATGDKRKLTNKEKRELKREARRKARAGSDEEDAAGGIDEDAAGFAVNLADPRFVDMFQNAEFALDPTDPRFKKMQAREKVMTEVQKRRVQQPAHEKPEGPKQGHQEHNGAAAENGTTEPPQQGRGASNDLRIMVAKLKRKAEAQQEKERVQALGNGQKKARF